VFFSQVRGGLLAVAECPQLRRFQTDSFMPVAAALATSLAANGECLPETAGQRSLAAPSAHPRLCDLQQEDAHETYTRLSGFGEVGGARLAMQSVALCRHPISAADILSSLHLLQLLAAEVGKAQSRLSEVMQGVLAPFAADLKNQVRWVAAENTLLSYDGVGGSSVQDALQRLPFGSPLAVSASAAQVLNCFAFFFRLMLGGVGVGQI
jgi:hypothetical protein